MHDEWNIDKPALAISVWRFPVDNRAGSVQTDNFNSVFAKNPYNLPIELLCFGADWDDECRASALGG